MFGWGKKKSTTYSEGDHVVVTAGSFKDRKAVVIEDQGFQVVLRVAGWEAPMGYLHKEIKPYVEEDNA